MKIFPTRVDMIKALGGHGVEVGVQRGDFSAEILPYVESLVLVDAWDARYGDERDPATVRQAVHDGNRACTQGRFASEPKVRIVPYPSACAIRLFDWHDFDWCYIDAGHGYLDVYQDLKDWSGFTEVICGHDYTDRPEAKAMGFGVKQAVDDFCEHYNWELVALTDEQWPSYQLERK